LYQHRSYRSVSPAHVDHDTACDDRAHLALFFTSQESLSQVICDRLIGDLSGGNESVRFRAGFLLRVLEIAQQWTVPFHLNTDLGEMVSGPAATALWRQEAECSHRSARP
jgi:hypothetical protein